MPIKEIIRNAKSNNAKKNNDILIDFDNDNIENSSFIKKSVISRKINTRKLASSDVITDDFTAEIDIVSDGAEEESEEEENNSYGFDNEETDDNIIDLSEEDNEIINVVQKRVITKNQPIQFNKNQPVKINKIQPAIVQRNLKNSETDSESTPKGNGSPKQRFLNFLRDHKNDNTNKNKSEKKDWTNTAFGDPWGTFCIDDAEYAEYLELYKDVVGKMDLHMTERPKRVGPLTIDIDFKLESKDRKYNIDDIEYIITKITSKLNKYFKLAEHKLNAFVFEKVAPTFEPKKRIYKDGFHMMYPFIPMDNIMRRLIIEECQSEVEFEQGFEHLSLLNELEDVFDKSIIETNGWMMYGSRKHDAKMYSLTKVYTSKLKTEKTRKYSDQELVEILSVRQYADKDCVEPRFESMPAATKTLYKKLEQQNDKKLKAKKVKKVDINDLIADDEENNKTHINAYIESENDDEGETDSESSDNNGAKKLKITKSELELVHKLVDLLSMRRCENYSDWIQLGWTLHNIDKKLLNLFMTFSKKSKTKYEPGCCEKLWRDAKDDGLTMGTLHWWAKQDDPEGYNDIMRNELKKILEQAESGTHYDIACVVHALYNNNYKCSSIKHGIWYEFQGHRWVQIDGAYTLSIKISEELTKEFMQLSSVYLQEGSTQEKIEKDWACKKNEMCSKIIANLKKSGFKDSILKECANLFYDKSFEEKLDANRDLIGFNNGVFDLKKGFFRSGAPDDNISFTTGYCYKQYKETDPEVAEINKYFGQVQRDEEMRNYILTLISSYLDGYARDQKFVLWTGTGCHARDEKIRMYDGSVRKVQNINLGDKIMGDDGHSRTVETLFRGAQSMYKITHKNSIKENMSYTVNENHRLALKSVFGSSIKFDEEFGMWLLEWDEYVEAEMIPIKRGKYFSEKEACELYQADLTINPDIIRLNDIIPVTVGDWLKLDTHIQSHFKAIHVDIVLNEGEKNGKKYTRRDVQNEVLSDIVVEGVGKNKFFGFELDGNKRYVLADGTVTFNSNGKSKTVELIQYAFGEYFDILPNTVLTKKRGASSGATPELADKRGKRFVVLQEPEGDDKINVGYMKELTGGDWIHARPLYKDPFKYQPQFKLLLTCNKLPHIPSTDGGTWRRLRVTPWETEFVDGVPTKPNQYRKDVNLTDKLEKCKRAFMWLLLAKYYPKYRSDGLQEPKKVTQYTNKYKEDSDTYFDFLSNNYEFTKDNNDKEDLATMFEIFKTWHAENHGKAPKKKEFINYLLTKDYIQTANDKNMRGIKLKLDDDDDKNKEKDKMKFNDSLFDV